MISLQQVLEAILQGPMDAFLRERLYHPLGMKDTLFNPPQNLRSRCVPTEDDKSLRKRLLQGEVHDPAAFACGGRSGNAGLFSTARDTAVFLRMMLEKGSFGGRQVLCASTVEAWTKRQAEKSTRALGWDTRSPKGSSAGSRFSLRSYGHTGYTGTSVWVDPEHRIFVALLTNRVHPTSENPRILNFRPRFHDAAFAILVPNPS
jgi:CubicO group peptidase (beta-lactamase class C family)